MSEVEGRFLGTTFRASTFVMFRSIYLVHLLAVSSAVAQSPFEKVVVPPGDPALAPYITSAVAPDGKFAFMHGGMPAAKLIAVFNDTLGSMWAHKVMPGSVQTNFQPSRLVWNTDGELTLCGTVNQGSYGQMRLSTTGSVLWTRMYHAADQWLNYYSYGFTAATPDSGTVVLLTKGHDVFSSSFPHVFLMRLDRSGNVVWSRESQFPSYFYPFDVQVDAAGNMLILTSATATLVDPAGNQSWSLAFPGVALNCAGHLSNGDWLIGASTGALPAAMRISTTGTPLWLKRYDFPAGFNAAVKAVDELPSGDLLLFPPSGSTSAFIIRTDPGGNPISFTGFPADYLTSSIEMIGEANGMYNFIGDAYIPVDGGYIHVPRFISQTDTIFQFPCGSGTIPLTATALALPVPNPGITLIPDSVHSWSFAYTESGAIFTSYDLRDSITLLFAGMTEPAPEPIRAFPSPVAAGQIVQIELGEPSTGISLARYSVDGRRGLIEIDRQEGTSLWVSTTGWGAGMHLIEVNDRQGTRRGMVKVLVE